MDKTKALTPEQELEVCEMYEQVERARPVAEAFGVSYQTIYRVLRRHDIPRTHRHPKPNRGTGSNHKGIDRSRVGELYEGGSSVREIANEMGCSYQTVCYHLERLGLYEPSKRKAATGALVSQILELHGQEMSDYEIADELGVSRYVVNYRLCKADIRRGRGSNSHKGGIASGKKMRAKAIERYRDVADRVSLIEYRGRDSTRVQCVCCGTQFTWTRDHWKMDVPCPACRNDIGRKLREEEQRRTRYERQQQLEAAREWRLSVPRICECCGMPFYSEYETAIYCSPQCKRKAKVRRNNKRMQRNGCNSRNKYKRRMRIDITENTFDRSVTLDAVYKKYRGKCCWCGCKTVRTKNSVSNQATLDHVIALNNNGTHTWDNVQLLCRDCNCNKRDLGQMRLPIAI